MNHSHFSPIHLGTSLRVTLADGTTVEGKLSGRTLEFLSILAGPYMMSPALKDIITAEATEHLTFPTGDPEAGVAQRLAECAACDWTLYARSQTSSLKPIITLILRNGDQV